MQKIIRDIHNAEQNSRKTVAFLQKNSSFTWRGEYPAALQTSCCICLKKPQKGDYAFLEKFDPESWKKIQDETFNMRAFVQSSKFKDSTSSVKIETHLREIMQNAKAVPAFKAIGFVWIATFPKATQVTDILEHYFGDNHIFIEKGRKITYIAWDERLVNQNLNLKCNF